MGYTKNASESEQMYLVTIARLSEMVTECPIPIAKVAEVLDITPISANQMIHNLQQMGFLTYTPYKGVEFTEKGWKTGAKLLRIRRLWEVFLVEYLSYTPAEAELMACKLEHAISEETANRLADFLGWPQVSPQGIPIPHDGVEDALDSGILLSKLPLDTTGIVRAIQTGNSEKSFLERAGITIGCRLKVIACQQGESYLVQCGEGTPVNLSAVLAGKIFVLPEK
jgi:DtxR family Mn-dependent transcriptional regulator